MRPHIASWICLNEPYNQQSVDQMLHNILQSSLLRKVFNTVYLVFWIKQNLNDLLFKHLRIFGVMVLYKCFVVIIIAFTGQKCKAFNTTGKQFDFNNVGWRKKAN